MINEVIEQRHSVRKYRQDKVDDAILNKLRSNLDTYVSMGESSQGQARFQIIENAKDSGLGFLWGLGRINAPYCIASIVSTKEQELEVGFALEQQVLYLTEQGIGTCWLGTFDRKVLAAQCNLQDQESVCYVVAFGYFTEKGFMNNGFRKIVGGHKRKPFQEICLADESELNPLAKEAISMAILGPSGNNAQPVRALPEEGAIHLYQKGDAYVDTGIFLAHCYVILNKYKEAGKLQDVTITLGGERTNKELKEVACIRYQ